MSCRKVAFPLPTGFGGVPRLSCLCLALALPGLARAQSGSSELALAESSYAEIDFDGTLSHAEAALEAGGLGRSQLVRVYELIGISAMTLDQRDRSREAFIRMLALNPDARLDRSLSPNLREPFLEARGFWATQTSQLSLGVDLVRERGALRLRLSDPIDIVRTVVVRARVEGAAEYQESRQDAAETLYVTVEGAAEDPRVEYSLVAFDEHGNRLFEVGDDDVPEVVGRGARAAADEGEATAERPRSRAWLWAIIGVLAAGVVGGGIATGVVLGQHAQTVTLSSDVVWIR